MKNHIFLVVIGIVLLSGGLVVYEKSHAQKTIYVVSMTPDEMTAGLMKGTIAGYISWEPHPAKAEITGYGRSLVDSGDVWENHPSCVLAISSDLRDENTIRALVWVHVKGTRFINDPANREKVLKYGSEFSGLDTEMTSEAIDNTMYIEYPDLNQTKKGIEILNEAGAFENTLTSVGYGSIEEFLSDLFLDKYYSEVRKKLEEDPDWIPPAINRSLKFGYIGGNIHYLTMYVAQKEGYFEKVGLIPEKSIQFVPYRSGRAITDAFKHNEVDVANVGSVVLLKYRINDNGRVNIINAVNSGGSSLIVRNDSDIGSIDDLNGLTIATPGFGTCQDVIMRKMFEGYEIKTI